MNSIHNTRDVSFIFEVGSMRHIDRTWRQFGGAPMANDAEHSFRVAWIAWMIATREGADVSKVVQLALIHDVSEVRSGDVNYLTRVYVSRDENRAIEDTFAGSSLSSAAKELWDELQQKITLEARIVKDADFLDCDFELCEMSGGGFHLKEALMPARKELRNRLYTETGRSMFDLVYSTDPHGWHTGGPNRITQGDWAARRDKEVR